MCLLHCNKLAQSTLSFFCIEPHTYDRHGAVKRLPTRYSNEKVLSAFNSLSSRILYSTFAYSGIIENLSAGIIKPGSRVFTAEYCVKTANVSGLHSSKKQQQLQEVQHRRTRKAPALEPCFSDKPSHRINLKVSERLVA